MSKAHPQKQLFEMGHMTSNIMEKNSNVERNTNRFFVALVVIGTLVVVGSYMISRSGQTGIIDNQAMTVIAPPMALIAPPTSVRLFPLGTCQASANGVVETAANVGSTIETFSVCNFM